MKRASSSRLHAARRAIDAQAAADQQTGSGSERNRIFHRHRVIRTYEQFLDLRDAWNELLTHLPSYLPSMTFEWNHAWIRAGEKEIEYLYVLVFYSESNQVTGIVPFYSAASGLPGLRRKTLNLIGDKDHYMINFLTLQEHHLQLIRRTLEVIQRDGEGWHFVFLRRISQAQALSIQVERVLTAGNFRFATESFIKVPVIYLQGEFNSFCDLLKKHFRKELRRKRRRLEELNQGKVCFHTHHLADGEAPFDAFLDLERRGWKGSRASALTYRERLLQTYRHLREGASDRLSMVVFQLSLGSRIISSSICLETRTGMYVFRIAYDESYARFSPGLLLRLHEIEYAFSRKLEVYNFSGVEQPWMRHFTQRGHHSMDFIVYGDSWMPALHYFYTSRLKPFIKRRRFYRAMKNSLPAAHHPPQH